MGHCPISSPVIADPLRREPCVGAGRAPHQRAWGPAQPGWGAAGGVCDGVLSGPWAGEQCSSPVGPTAPVRCREPGRQPPSAGWVGVCPAGSRALCGGWGRQTGWLRMSCPVSLCPGSGHSPLGRGREGQARDLMKRKTRALVVLDSEGHKDSSATLWPTPPD